MSLSLRVFCSARQCFSFICLFIFLLSRGSTFFFLYSVWIFSFVLVRECFLCFTWFDIFFLFCLSFFVSYFVQERFFFSFIFLFFYFSLFWGLSSSIFITLTSFLLFGFLYFISRVFSFPFPFSYFQKYICFFFSISPTLIYFLFCWASESIYRRVYLI